MNKKRDDVGILKKEGKRQETTERNGVETASRSGRERTKNQSGRGKEERDQFRPFLSLSLPLFLFRTRSITTSSTIEMRHSRRKKHSCGSYQSFQGQCHWKSPAWGDVEETSYACAQQE